MKNRKSKPVNCKYFKKTNTPFGGCKHPEAVNACLEKNMYDCEKAISRYKLKK